MPEYTSPGDYWGLSYGDVNRLPLGLRTSNNLFNIKYFPGAERNQSQWPGLIGPSSARDQGDPQMLFRNPEDSGVAGAQLLRRKYNSGLRTTQQLIADPNSGWTPGNTGAAANIARSAGLRPDEDARLDTPEGIRRFLPALAEQEHGAQPNLFTPALFDRIVNRIGGPGATAFGVPRMSLGGPDRNTRYVEPEQSDITSNPVYPGDAIPMPIMPTPTQVPPPGTQFPQPIAPADTIVPAPGPIQVPMSPDPPAPTVTPQPPIPRADAPVTPPVDQPRIPSAEAPNIPAAPNTPADNNYPDEVYRRGGPPVSDTGAQPKLGAARGPNGQIAGGFAPAAAQPTTLASMLLGPDIGGAFGNFYKNWTRDPFAQEMLRLWGGYGPGGASVATAGLTDERERERIALEQAKGVREEDIFQRDKAEYQRRLQAYNKIAADPNSTATKDMSPELRSAFLGLGPQDAPAAIAKYQMLAADEKRKMELEVQKKVMAIKAAQAETFGTPGASSSAQPSSMSPSYMGGPSQFDRGGAAIPPPLPPQQPPAIAPAAPSPGAPVAPVAGVAPSAGGIPQTAGAQFGGTGGGVGRPGAEPSVPVAGVPGGWLPLSAASRYAQMLNAFGTPDAQLEAQITRAGQGPQQYSTKMAELAATQEQQKPQARMAMSKVLDGLNLVEDRAEALRKDENLTRVVGENVSPYDDPNAAMIPATNIPVEALKGPFGSRIKSVGDPAWDTRSDLVTLAGEIGLSTLEAMREASKSGSSGLGGTSETEINMLQRALADIKDLRISPEKMRQNLKIIVDVTKNVRERLLGGWRENYQEEFFHPGGPPRRPAAERTYDITDKMTKAQKRNAGIPTDQPSSSGVISYRGKKYVEDPTSSTGFREQ